MPARRAIVKPRELKCLLAFNSIVDDIARAHVSILNRTAMYEDYIPPRYGMADLKLSNKFFLKINIWVIFSKTATFNPKKNGLFWTFKKNWGGGAPLHSASRSVSDST